ncbi:sigma-70 family RNA polymerase sigma factor [Chitinophaga ginsengisoli]|uniref:RNA polymerase sigma-70 factor (ECF subfamily) n=1 Tax=Chitinophaga ginsengisoli TaxID=363837 RepID=A0A2P8GDK3_9BACT|nr:sigma-70 family RNA polymerase sigma factor [Chitinophaga ginsengisoli]PSL32069.1 RNA polymerase sigma-70 factor (ECF subfamily) [Chitinophaga ginsengisoli]
MLQDYQRTLFPYAYNILGSVEDAKDTIQDVLSNYISTQREGIENEKAYLVRSVINQSINAKNKRKTVNYEEVWLPEPVATGEEADKALHLQDIGSYTMLILMEALNPKERAVFILKEGFGYSHEEIAEVLSGTVEQSRKLLSRAKGKLDEHKQGAPLGNKTVSAALLDQYLHALRKGDVQRLENMLSQDIVFYADGGGKVNVAKKFCTGLHDVSQLLVFVFNKYQQDFTFEFTVINHEPALLFFRGEKLFGCQVFSISPEDHKILRISTVLDPDKLKNMGR